MSNDTLILPAVIIERPRKYWAETCGDWGGWCDGNETNKGHFQGIDVQSILADGVEVKLCKDCIKEIGRRQDNGMSETPLTDYGYLIDDVNKKFTYDEVMSAINLETLKIIKLIEDKDKGLAQMRMYLSCLGYSHRTAWLLYQNKAEGEK